MRIAILNLTAGGLSGGYRKYLVEMLPRFADHPDVEAVTVFGPARAFDGLSDIGLPTYSWSAREAWLGFPGVRRELRARRPDVVFVPTARCLDVAPLPTVVMVRNMEPLEFPFGRNPFPEALRNLLRARDARRASRRATRVIAVSQHVRDVLIAHWRMTPDRIGVVPHGVDQPGPTGEVTEPAWLAGRPRTPFVFTAGSIRPARGLEDLVRAMGRLRSEGIDLSAVIAGGVDRFMGAYAGRLQRMADELGVADRLVWAGSLTSREMAWCFRHAALFVMTSRAEACPNIALEAMSHGCSCVSVAVAPMPEFFGQGAIYYQAGEAADLADAVRRVVSESESVSAARRALAVQRARVFTWDRTVEGTIAQLQLAIAAQKTAGATARSGLASDERRS